jgi:DNA polymerase type B, organellar and viral
LKNAQNFGYKIEVVESYIFDKGYGVFDNFVKDFYERKKNSIKSERLIYKLILNSLYGRFGMKVDSDIIKLVTPEERDKLAQSYPIEDIIPISNDIEIIKYKRIPDKSLCEVTGTNYNKLLLKVKKDLYPANTSVGIAAAIASYARIEISQYLTKYNENLYYSDTDSIVLNKPIPITLIGDKIGDMKLEYKNIEIGLFITPKVYYLRLSNNEEIMKAKSINNVGLTLKDYLNLYNGFTIKKFEER